MGKRKFIAAFPPRSVKSKTLKERLRLINNLLLECISDPNISQRIRRSEDMVMLSLQIGNIMTSPEYSNMKNPDKIRYTIAQLIVDPEHRKAVETIIKRNKSREMPKFEPICKYPNIKDPTRVLKIIFENYIDAWDTDNNVYRTNKAAQKFHLAMKDLMSKDWLHKHCILAGYVPVSKARKLSEIGRIVATTCGCRKFDRFRYKKTFMEQLRKETLNFRYHTMHRVLKKINQKTYVRYHRRPQEGYLMSGKQTRPGIWSRVFLATHSQRLEPTRKSESEDQYSIASEREMLKTDLKDMSTPTFSNTVGNVAVKVFAMTPNLPLKLIPARVITHLEISTVVDHPNIVRFTETFATQRDIFMVMRFEENRNLHLMMNRNGRLMQKTAKIWTYQIALALQYLHSAGIVHRNVKCSNILISKDYVAILSGFGSAKVKWMDLLHVQVAESRNYKAGYRPYRAPEVLRRRPYRMPPIDVWGLGIVLFVMLNNSFPFCYHNKKMMLHLQTLKKWRKSWNRDFPTSNHCLDLLKRMLAPDPSKRLTIDDVVNHSWFQSLPVPSAHTKALKRAPFLFLYRDSVRNSQDQAVFHHQSHKLEKDTLEEISALLTGIINRAEKRIFKPVDSLQGYQDCYKNYLGSDNLLSKISTSLKKPIRRSYRSRSALTYEPYISDTEELEMHEKTAANIEELKERTEQVRKILEPSHKEDKMKKALADVVNKVKEKTVRMNEHREELMKKVAIFMPKNRSPEAEPRSILQMKSISAREKLLNELRNKNASMSKLSITTSEWRSGLGVKHSKDFSNMDFASIINLSKSKPEEGTLPQLGFVKHHRITSFSDINENDSKQQESEQE
ncbi:hypothetical protein GE061_005050 [Apolygus lucorum]|uniref:Protein kinase domain-containing protein n=1 Tax=Apolygus lucorum TaxID=248454 RepID=A0A8S9WV80_APOLU|nr:hypothetical protein GE061_005050 [Apolygus lucorum]